MVVFVKVKYEKTDPGMNPENVSYLIFLLGKSKSPLKGFFCLFTYNSIIDV